MAIRRESEANIEDLSPFLPLALIKILFLLLGVLFVFELAVHDQLLRIYPIQIC